MITVKRIRKMEITDFTQAHGLEIKVRERPKEYNLPLFFASISNVELSNGIFLKSVIGNGDTPDEAIRDYCEKVSNKFVVIDAYGNNRKELTLPALIHTTK